MKFFRSYKPNKSTKYLAAAILAAAYFLGFSARVYSPVHLGHYAIPIPILIKAAARQQPLQTAASSHLTAVQGAWIVAGSPVGGLAGSPPAFNHKNIITTYFWVGEPADGDNGGIANLASAWDGQWQSHYGGVDAPSPRSGYNPANFTPKENPFYFALPYNDLDASGHRKNTAVSCYFASTKRNYSWCKNGWIAIQHNGKTAYAQWEDVGPFGEDDYSYVFGSAQPKNKQGSSAGLDVSPAVRDYLGLDDVDSADWGFVTVEQVPSGPWKATLSTDLGDTVN